MIVHNLMVGDTLVMAKYDEIIIWDDNNQTKYIPDTTDNPNNKTQ